MIKSAAISKDNKVYTGRTHSSIIENNNIKYDSDYTEGFITDKDVFVDRSTAAKIAFECKQTSEEYNQLYSYHI